MKTKTIEKVLQKKINEWLNSITDDRVRVLARKNTIVTGGSIASMLLNEPVNDYDIYFRNIETVIAVANYYTDRINKSISPLDTIVTVDCSNSSRVKLQFQSDKIFYYSVTGEGSLMAEQDEVHTTKNIYGDISVASDKVEVGSYSPLFFTPNAITLSDQVQLVLRFYGEASQLHNNYDYVHATNYYDHKEEKVFTNSAALESLLTKQLRYIGSLYPVTSVIRSKKFIKRGWTITAGEYFKILFQVSELDLTDPEVLFEQLSGVDVGYFSIVIDAIENRDDKKYPKVTYPYVCEVINRVFN